jgi:hypothetical protein
LGTQPPEFYWFEAFEMLRKFTLTGLPLLTRLVSQGSNTESVWGTLLTAAFTVYVNSVVPYVDDVDQLLSLCAHFQLVTTMIGGMGHDITTSRRHRAGAHATNHRIDGREIFIAVVVIAPAAVLIAILVYGIIDPEYKTWFARKCVLVFRQLQSYATCYAPSDGWSNNESDDGNPMGEKKEKEKEKKEKEKTKGGGEGAVTTAQKAAPLKAVPPKAPMRQEIPTGEIPTGKTPTGSTASRIWKKEASRRI